MSIDKFGAHGAVIRWPQETRMRRQLERETALQEELKAIYELAKNEKRKRSSRSR